MPYQLRHGNKHEADSLKTAYTSTIPTSRTEPPPSVPIAESGSWQDFDILLDRPFSSWAAKLLPVMVTCLVASLLVLRRFQCPAPYKTLWRTSQGFHVGLLRLVHKAPKCTRTSLPLCAPFLRKLRQTALKGSEARGPSIVRVQAPARTVAFTKASRDERFLGILGLYAGRCQI